MYLKKIRLWVAALATTLLVACGGGGGDAGSAVLPGPGSGGGGVSGASVTLSLSTTTVTPTSPATVTVMVRDAGGNPVAGTVVDLKTERGTLAALAVASVATGVNGSATVVLTAGTGGLSGADQVIAVAKLGTTTVQGSVSFTVAGSEPTITLAISASTLRGVSGSETLRALVKDAAGSPVPNLLVTFESLGKRVKLGALSAKTDAFGYASITAAVADTTLTGADTLTASAVVGTVKVSSSVVVQLLADTPSLLLTASNSNVTAALPVTLAIQVSDANGKSVGAGTVVSLASSFGLTAFDASTVVTNANGLAQAVLTPKSGTSNGADQIIASATVAGTPVSAQLVLQISSSALTSVTLVVTPSLITTSSPATVNVFVRDAKGAGVSGAVVDLSTVRGGVATLSVSSVSTDSNGNATAILSAANAGRGGADQVVGVIRSGTAAVQGSASFTVAGTLASASLRISSATLRGSTGVAILIATVRDALGNPAPNIVVSFASAGGGVKLSAASAVSNGAGEASISASVADASITAAETLVASATVGSVQVQATVAVQLLADTPTIELTPSRSTATAAAPSILTVLVKSATGIAVGAGTVVNVSSVFGLSAFDAVTVVTNAAGFATVAVIPKTATSNGADQIVVTATVAGVVVSNQVVLQVQSSSLASVIVSISSSTITSASPATVTVTVRDATGAGVPGALVDLSTVRGGFASLGAGSVATSANGTASTTLSAIPAGLSGADQVVGVTRMGASSVQGLASFTVAGNVSTIGLTISSTTLRASTGPATLSAVLRDANGAVVPNVLVSFASGSSRVGLSAPSAMTNASGIASVQASVADASSSAAETLTATATLGSGTTQSSLVVQLLADTPTLKITASNSNVSALAPATLTFTVKDGAGAPVGAGFIVSVSSAFGLSAFDASTAVTNASGIAQVVVSPKTVTSNGADRIIATTNVGGVAATDQLVLQIQTSTSTSVAIAVSSPTITSASPATVTVTVLDAKGLPMAGAVVDLSMVRGTLASLNVASVATNANGMATAILSASPGGLSGADQIVGVVKSGAATAQGSAGFSVTGSAPTLNLTLTPSPTIRNSTGTGTLSAVVRDAGGNLVTNLLVNFSSTGGRVKLGSTTAMTNSSGVASITVSASDASVTAADTLTASATIGAMAVQSALVVQLLADTPSMTISGNSSVTAAVPSTLSVLVKDTSGAAVGQGVVVRFTSSFGLSAFDATTVATDSTGIARVTVTPKSSSSNGADEIVASTTVGGVVVSRPFVVQVASTTLNAPPLLQTTLSSTSISSATPATVTAALTDGRGQAVAGEVITFTVLRGLAKTNIGTALTDALGRAVVILSPTSSTTAGADEVSATTTYAGTALQSTKGFQIQATNVTLSNFLSAVSPLGPYGQTTLTLDISGASVGSPVNISVTSSCVSLGKATLSPASFTATGASASMQYKDNGCGALQSEDKLQASIVGGSGSVSLTLPVTAPNASSVAFISASPEVIYLKGSGFTETSTVTFEVRDRAGNILPNRSVTLSLLTVTGGVTMEGGIADVVQISDAAGRVTVRVNSGTLPTPIRISATLTGVSPIIATVSSSLSVAVGLPSQLNFSLSQKTKNIEGWNIDGTPNTYSIIASDRNGNPVPAGTSINFVTEGGQVEPIKQIQLVAGLAQASAAFLSADPRPADGRVTVTVYALGEESFVDQNGNNRYDAGEPFQDLGNVFKDRLFDGIYDPSVDEYIPTNINNASACVAPGSAAGANAVTNALLALDPSIPSVGGNTCDSTWSGGGKVYVRRAVETVLSTSAARALWLGTSGLGSSCQSVTLQTGSASNSTVSYTRVASGETWYGTGGTSMFLNFIVGDNHRFPAGGPSEGRLNPMAAGTTVTASTPTAGLKLTVSGSPVPSTSEASTASIGVGFDTVSAGVVFVTFTSPSGLGTTYAINVQQTSVGKVGTCP